MWKRKKVIFLAVLAIAVLVGSTAGIALAQTGSASNSSGKTLLARVATILGIDQKKVEDAFAQAQREMQQEALDNYLKNLVDQGKITQQQADQYKNWWQARPDTPLPGPFGRFGGHGFRGGMKWGKGYQFWGSPTPQASGSGG